jgi:hypothetical protein
VWAFGRLGIRLGTPTIAGAESQHLHLPWRGLLFELLQRNREGDDPGALPGTPSRRSVETLGVIGVAAQDLVALDGVHGVRIGPTSLGL